MDGEKKSSVSEGCQGRLHFLYTVSKMRENDTYEPGTPLLQHPADINPFNRDPLLEIEKFD